MTDGLYPIIASENPSLTFQNLKNNPVDQLKIVNGSLEEKQNKIKLLKKQLQSEKSSIKKHKSLTEDMIYKKLQFQQIRQLISKDVTNQNEQIVRQRQINNSLRQKHKLEMNNILKAVYLVKLDDAREVKNNSIKLKQAIDQIQMGSLKQKQLKNSYQNAQGERAKGRYKQYWKNKLNSIYRKKNLDKADIHDKIEYGKIKISQLKSEQENILKQISIAKNKSLEIKNRYKEVSKIKGKQIIKVVGCKESNQIIKSKEKREMSSDQFFTKSAIMSIMTTNDLKIPRAHYVNSVKVNLILSELRRLEKLEQGSSECSS